MQRHAACYATAPACCSCWGVQPLPASVCCEPGLRAGWCADCAVPPTASRLATTGKLQLPTGQFCLALRVHAHLQPARTPAAPPTPQPPQQEPPAGWARQTHRLPGSALRVTWLTERRRKELFFLVNSQSRAELMVAKLKRPAAQRGAARSVRQPAAAGTTSGGVVRRRRAGWAGGFQGLGGTQRWVQLHCCLRCCCRTPLAARLGALAAPGRSGVYAQLAASRGAHATVTAAVPAAGSFQVPSPGRRRAGALCAGPCRSMMPTAAADGMGQLCASQPTKLRRAAAPGRSTNTGDAAGAPPPGAAGWQRSPGAGAAVRGRGRCLLLCEHQAGRSSRHSCAPFFAVPSEVTCSIQFCTMKNSVIPFLTSRWLPP